MTEAYIGTHLTDTGTTVVCARPCVLHTFTITAETTDAVTIYDDATVIAAIPTATPAQTFVYDIVCKKNLTITLAGGGEYVVSHKPLHI